MKNKVYSSTLLAVLLLLVLLVAGVIAADKSDSKILFLHLRIDQQSVSYLDQTVVTGALKQSRGKQTSGELLWEVYSSSGEVIFTDAMSNPLVKRYEYEDPDNPGILKIKIINLDQTEFVIRMPHMVNAAKLSFYEVIKNDGSKKVSGKKLLSTISLKIRSENGDE